MSVRTLAAIAFLAFVLAAPACLEAQGPPDAELFRFAEQDYADAQFNLGVAYLTGTGTGISLRRRAGSGWLPSRESAATPTCFGISQSAYEMLVLRTHR